MGQILQIGGTNTITTSGQVLALASSAGSYGTYDIEGGLLVIPGLTQGNGAAQFSFGFGTLQGRFSLLHQRAHGPLQVGTKCRL